MLLNRLRSARDDTGSTMAAVMGLMALIAVASIAILSSSVSSATSSTTARANIQSQASADAGIDVVYAKIAAGDYVCAVTSAVAPAFTATVTYKNSGGTALSCNTASLTSKAVGDPVSAEITSTGIAATSASGTTYGNTDKVVATASIARNQTSTTTETTTPAPITPSGPAIYSYSGGAFGGSGTLVSVNGSDPDIMIKDGDVTCTGGAQNGVSDFVVGGGALSLSGSCNITGNAWVTKRLNLSGGVKIGGNAVAAGVGLNSGTIGGSVWSTQDVTVDGNATINGNVTAASLPMKSGTIAGNAWVYGATSLSWGTGINGNLTSKTATQPEYSGNLVKGTKTVTDPSTPGASPYTTPSAPTAPGWADYSYKADDWNGFAVKTISGSSCGLSQLAAAVSGFAGGKGVILAEGCTNGVILKGAERLTIGNDVAIIAKKISLIEGASIQGSADAKLWLINPDSTVDRLPTCNAQNITIDGGFTMSSNLSMLVYSPCTLNIASGLVLYGQIYGTDVKLNGGATIYYKPIGLPGYNLGSGASTPTSTTVTSTVLGPVVYSAELLSRLDVTG